MMRKQNQNVFNLFVAHMLLYVMTIDGVFRGGVDYYFDGCVCCVNPHMCFQKKNCVTHNNNAHTVFGSKK